MQVNVLKSTLSPLGLFSDESINVQNYFPFHSNNFDDGLKYPEFHLKPMD